LMRGQKGGLNTAFLVSLITLISYVVMWKGQLAVVAQGGQTLFPTRWLFYGLSCTLLMYEIGQLKGVRGEGLVQLLYLTAIVMLTGFLAARDVTEARWIYFAISSVAYACLLAALLPLKGARCGWVRNYVFFGWTVFPIVFLLAASGIGVIGAALANLLYLVLDVYTKIVFNVRLAGTRAE